METAPELPAVPDGHIRLWRGIGAKAVKPYGPYWTAHKSIAEEYSKYTLEDVPARFQSLLYVDVPIDLAVTWRASGRLPGEFHLPDEIADTAKILVAFGFAL